MSAFVGFPLCSFAAVLQLPESSSEVRSRPNPQQGRSWSLGNCSSFWCAGRCRLWKRKADRLCDYFVLITSALGFNVTFHWFLGGIKPQRAVYRKGGKKQSCSQVSVRVSLILWVTALPPELSMVKELLVKQGSNPDAATFCSMAVFPPAFPLTSSNLKKKDNGSAVLPPQSCSAQLALMNILVGIHSSLCRIWNLTYGGEQES